MKITKYEDLMLRIEELSKDKVKNAAELKELSIQLANQKEQLHNLDVAKVKAKLKNKNISYAEYCNLQDLLVEKKIYKKKAALINEVISGNSNRVHQKGRVVVRGIFKTAVAAGLTAAMALCAVSCLNKNSKKNLDNDSIIDEVDNSIKDDKKESNKGKDSDKNKDKDTTEQANEKDGNKKDDEKKDSDKKDGSDKKGDPDSEKPEDTTTVETTDTTPEPDEPVVTEDIVPEKPEDPDPNEPDPTVPDKPTPEDPVVPPITPDTPEPDEPVPDTPEPDDPAPDEPTPDDPAPVDPSIPDPDDPPKPVDPEIPEPDTPPDVVIVIPPKPDDPLPPVPDYDIDEKNAPKTEVDEFKAKYVKDTIVKEEVSNTDKKESVYISEGTAINPEIPYYFDIYVYKTEKDKIMDDEAFVDTITGTMPSLDNVDDNEVDEMVYSVSNGKKLVLTFDNNN